MEKRKQVIGLLVLMGVLTGVLYIFLLNRTGSEIHDGVLEIKAMVNSVDNSEVVSNGLSTIGIQKVDVTIMENPYKDVTVQAINQLNGQIDIDQLYRSGDKVIIGVQIKKSEIFQARTIELYRQEWLVWLFLFFVITLLIYAGVIGFTALLSFVISLWILWGVFVKGLLTGGNPLVLAGVTVVLLSAVIIFLVTGLTRRGIAAFLGTLIGLLVTLVLTLFFGFKMGLFGLTQPYVQTLFISGYYDLDYREIFYAAIILGASGAAMDIAVDISAAIHEIKVQNPEIETNELVRSGFNVGRQVIGTMATTLLLAYSGSYLTLLMLFMAKDASVMRILNLKIVAGEIMRTLIGSIGLVMVAPSTALLAGLIENSVLLNKSVEFQKGFKSIQKY